MKSKPIGENRKEFLEYLEKFCLLDDTFMRKYFEEKECVEEVLRIILDNKDLEVIENNTQHIIANLQGKEIVLDIYAIDDENVKYDIEVENSKKRANPQRARYNSSLIDANMLPKGEETIELPENCVIFMTKKDYFKEKLPIYHIRRYVEEIDKPFEDGSTIIYVNGDYKDTSTELGKLIHDINCTKASDMINNVLQNRMKQLKESEEGVDNMCDLMEELQEKGRLEGKNEGLEKVAVNLLKQHCMSIEQIVSVTGLTLGRVKELEAAL